MQTHTQAGSCLSINLFNLIENEKYSSSFEMETTDRALLDIHNIADCCIQAIQ